jgi:hypothetical protein
MTKSQSIESDINKADLCPSLFVRVLSRPFGSHHATGMRTQDATWRGGSWTALRRDSPKQAWTPRQMGSRLMRLQLIPPVLPPPFPHLLPLTRHVLSRAQGDDDPKRPLLTAMTESEAETVT